MFVKLKLRILREHYKRMRNSWMRMLRMLLNMALRRLG
jgi:hypothetical protein